MSARNTLVGKATRRLVREIDDATLMLGAQPAHGWDRVTRRLRENQPGKYAAGAGLEVEKKGVTYVEHRRRVTDGPEELAAQGA